MHKYSHLDSLVDHEQFIKDFQDRRLFKERIKMLIMLAMITCLALSLATFGVSLVNYKNDVSYKGRGEIVYRISETLRAIVEEGLASLLYVAEGVNNSISDTSQAKHIEELQNVSRSTFSKCLSSYHQLCPTCVSPFTLLNYGQFLSMQNEVLLRTTTVVNAFDFYRHAAINLGSSMAYFLGFSTGEHTAHLRLLEDLVAASQAMSSGFLISRQIVASAGTVTQPTFERGTQLHRLLVELSDTSWVVSRSDLDTREEFVSILSYFMEAMESIGGTVKGNFDNLEITGEILPYEMIDMATEQLDALLAAINKETLWNRYSFTIWYVFIALSAASTVVCLVVLVLLCRDVMNAVREWSHELYEVEQGRRMELSLARMKAFINYMYDFDVSGVQVAARISAKNDDTTLAEANLMKLEPSICQVLRFINPCILARCANTNANKEILEASNSTDLLDVEAVTGDGLNTVQDESAVGLSSMDITASGFKKQSVCLLLIDIATFFCPVTSDTVKTLPKEILSLMETLSVLAGAHSGTLLGAYGSTLTFGWNVIQEIDEAEVVACNMCLQIQKELMSTFSHLRCAVVSGMCSQGVLGSATFQSYIISGNLWRLGRLLLHIAGLHCVPLVVDHNTFLRVSAEQFHMRSIEVAGLDENSTEAENKTIVYELSSVEHNQRGAVFLWNEAFDIYKRGRTDEARAILQQWQKSYGRSVSWKRMMALLNETPEGRPCTYLNSTGVGFDVDLFL